MRGSRWSASVARLRLSESAASWNGSKTTLLLAQRDEYVRHRQAEIGSLRARLERTTSELADLGESLEQAQRFNRRVEESVTWQTFQRMRGRVFSSIGGETSLLARGLRFSLRLAGRVTSRRAAPTALEQVQEQEALDALAQSIELPTFDQPRVSLVIPLFAAADLTRRCLETIRDNTMAIGYEVILVDDTADTDTKQLLEQVTWCTGARQRAERGLSAQHEPWGGACARQVDRPVQQRHRGAARLAGGNARLRRVGRVRGRRGTQVRLARRIC